MQQIECYNHLVEEIIPFLDRFFKRLKIFKIDIDTMQLDHIAYQASTPDEYNILMPEFLKAGELIREVIIKDRRVAVFKFFRQVNYREYSIEAAELIEPVADTQPESGWEHAEFVLKESFESFITKHPNIPWDTSSMDRLKFAHLKLRLADNMQVKFHLHSILETS